MKEFKQLLGNRIYLEHPEEKEENVIIVDENTKQALEKELMSKMQRLKVYAVGESITNPNLVEGCEVLVDPGAIRDKAVMVPLTKHKKVIMVSMFDIIHIW